MEDLADQAHQGEFQTLVIRQLLNNTVHHMKQLQILQTHLQVLIIGNMLLVLIQMVHSLTQHGMRLDIG